MKKGKKYKGQCKEENFFQAAYNGHLQVWPYFTLVISDGKAYYYKNGKEVWTSNPEYAKANFILREFLKGEK